MIGSKVDGKYLIKSLLGQGGMGSVYEAEHASTGRRCAVKVINSGDLTKNEQVLKRFEREARAAGAIDTQYITQVLDAGIDRESGLPFMAMEYLEGEDLQHMLKREGAVSPDLALRVVAQACLGLQKAHAANVVHRDIKPHNLFLAQREAGEIVVKLLDFGIAKVTMDQAQSREGAELTRTGNLLGSPLYVSPEQARGRRQIDHRTDIYSLGAVMYQMLCGQTPFEHATALGELILMVCTEAPPHVQDHAPWVSPKIAALVHRCLEKNPDERYQSAEELFEAVIELLPQDGFRINSRMLVALADSEREEEATRLPQAPVAAPIDTGTFQPVADPASANIPADAASTTGPVTQGTKPATRSSSTFAAIGALALAVVGGSVYAFTRPGAEVSPAASATVATLAPEPTAAPTASASAAAPLPVAPVVKKKRVKLVVIPTDAEVKVEGVSVELKDGLLELVGIPGKVFKVQASKGRHSQVEVEVVITEAGALPPKVEVKLGKKLIIARKPRKTPPAKTAPRAAGRPPPAIPTGIQRDEDEFNE